MNRRIRTALRRTGVTLAGLMLLLIAAAAIVLGTESGSRWALGQATRLVPGELQLGETSGTFLHGLRIAEFSYVYGTTRVTAENLWLQLDWMRSSLHRLMLQRLAADEIAWRSLGAPDPEQKPLRVSMPALPIRIGAATIEVRTLRLADRNGTDVHVRQLAIRGNRISADSAEATASGVTVVASRPDIRLAGDVPLSAEFSWQRADGQWSGSGRLGGSLADLEFKHALAGAYPATGEGRIFLLNRVEPSVDAIVRFEHWSLGPIVASDAEVRITGTTSAYQAELDVEISAGRTPPATALSANVTGAVEGNLQALTAVDLRANSTAGQLAAIGTLAWSPAFSTVLDIQARQLDPARFAALATGELDADVQLTASGTQQFSLRIDSLTGRYNDVPARATGHLSRNQDQWQCTACEVSLGPNRALIDGIVSTDNLSAKVSAQVPQLVLFWPALSGGLTADVELGGSTKSPLLSGTAEARDIAFHAWTVTALSATSRASSRQKVNFDVSVTGLGHDGRELGSGSARLAGETGAIDATVEWQLGELLTNVEGNIAINDAGFDAEIHAADISEPFSGTWRLAAPMVLSLQSGIIGTTAHSWENGEARLHLPRFGLDDGDLDIEAELIAVPLATLNHLLPEYVQLTGYIDAKLAMTQQDGQRDGVFDWAQRDTVVRITPPREEAIDVQVPVASARIRLSGTGADGQARLEIDPGVQGTLELAVERLAADTPLRGRLLFSGSEWGWVPAFLPEIDNFVGKISADLSADGTLAAPQLGGELRWENGSLNLPALNMPLSDIEVVLTGSSAGGATVAGTATSGSGKLAVDGRFDDLLQDDRSFTLQFSGRRATILNWPDYQLVASPDLVVAGGRSGISVRGEVSVDSAAIAVRELPEEAVSPSADVRVEGREAPVAAGIPLSGDVNLLLNENVHINAFGLDSNVEGALRFRLARNRDPRAEGELKLVGGVFTAYGQRLTIEEGTLTFTGPLDDPLIFVRAVREIEDLDGTVKAGLELRGRASNITSTVYSSPSMSQADALSYLVLGRPLEEATTADGSMLSGTAYALGLRQATMITGQIGQTLGLDQFAVSGSNQSTTSLVAGKQVNSRLYVRYAYGVFTQIGSLLLRYKLSKRLTIEAGTGESQSMDLLYLVEKP